ncbi:MAG: hypothetical protein ACRC1K_22255, partial [Planctomycetia bacterium]
PLPPPVDAVPPTAGGVQAPTVTTATPNTATVSVTYSDDDAGVDPASFGVDDLTVSNGATVTAFTVSGNVVTYTVTAPAATWLASPQGAYTISLVAGSVVDLAGNGIAGAASLGSFTVAVPTPPPPAPVENLAPVLTATRPVVLTNVAKPTGLVVSQLLRGRVSDGRVVQRGVAITQLRTAGKGRWQYSLNRGRTWITVSTSSVRVNRALLLRDTDRLRFVAGGGAGRLQMQYRAWDQTAGRAGARGNTAVNGGASAFSTGVGRAQGTFRAPAATAAGVGLAAALEARETRALAAAAVDALFSIDD